MATLKIGRLEFTVEKNGDRYDLRGKRGAHYYTMRNVPRPEYMFLCNARRFGNVMDGLWLTDKSGELTVVG